MAYKKKIMELLNKHKTQKGRYSKNIWARQSCNQK